MTIQEWISNPEDFQKGVELYEKYGNNPVYLAVLRKRGESDFMRADLIYELGKSVEQSTSHVVKEIPVNVQPVEGADEKKFCLKAGCLNPCLKKNKSCSLKQNGESTTKKAPFSIRGSVLNPMSIHVERWLSKFLLYLTRVVPRSGRNSIILKTMVICLQLKLWLIKKRST